MSNINVVRKNLGPVTAYKYAVQQGYTGTEQEFAALMASYATVAEEAESAKDDAIDAKTAAEAAAQIFPDAITSLNTDIAYSFAPLSLGCESYIKYNTVDSTITIPQDVMYLGNKVDDNRIYKAVNPNNPIVLNNINYNTYSTSVVKLVLDTESWEFKVIAYGTGNSQKNKLVAIVRIATSAFAGGLVTPYPWKIDGKPYGVDLTQYDNIVSIFDYNSIVKTAAHRGWYTHPENTLIAFKAARKQGCLYGETDIQFTSDGVPVLLHDDTINRTARNEDGTSLSETIYISDITYEDALNYDFGVYKGSGFTGIKIPTLDEFCKLCRNIGMSPYIELKTNANLSQNKVSTIVDVINKNGLREKVSYISFSPTYLEYVKSYDQTARLGLLVQTAITSSKIATAQGLKNGNNKVFISSNSLSDAECEMCFNANIPLEAWDIESLVGIRNANSYITGFTMNHFVAGKVLYNYNIRF